MDYWEGTKGMLAPPPPKLLGGGGWGGPPGAPSFYAYANTSTSVALYLSQVTMTCMIPEVPPVKTGTTVRKCTCELVTGST